MKTTFKLSAKARTTAEDEIDEMLAEAVKLNSRRKFINAALEEDVEIPIKMAKDLLEQRKDIDLHLRVINRQILVRRRLLGGRI